eukprot:CAMPEP_0177638088 /NCGR_PEP_ID=MMETSP0447-20121125/5306_1 /TAXON_ID=0 /ORGANISM="Stygamoeba regulata, Strain BSH-02190019" /LENGTH=438 /DNA_ID=CAMNT_0019140035 /DNA_START=24 /DNA_END=1340 /DNA_ORIENTATION=+
MDTNHDGSLDPNELVSGLRRLGVPTSRKHVAQLFAHVDKTHSNDCINYTEFRQFVLQQHQLLADLFDEMDLNNDGVLTAEEVLEGFRKAGYRISSGQAKELIKKADKDGDQRIDFDEFCTALLFHPSTNVLSVFDTWEKSAVFDSDSMALPNDHLCYRSALHTLAAGAIAGAVSRTCTAPADRLKVLLQAQVGASEFNGIVAGFRYMYKTGGWRGFFRGNGANVVKIAPESATKFLVYETLKQSVCHDPKDISMLERLFCGGFAGATAQLLIYPLEIAKTRLALAETGSYRGIAHCLLSIQRLEGARALFRGLVPSLAGIVPYAAVDLGMYSLLKDEYHQRYGHDPAVPALLACGAVSSSCGQLVAYPLQLVRTRLQAQGLPGRPMYNGMLHCMALIARSDGVRGFYRGLLPNFLKSLPAISISYAVYETAKKQLAAL